MGLLADVHEAQGGKRAGGNRCLLCRLIDGDDPRLPEGDRPELAEILESRGVFASTIIEVMGKRGVEVTISQIGNHRRHHTKGWAK